MHEKHKPLPIPPAAEHDPKAIEMFRGWIADGALHCEVNVGHWTVDDAEMLDDPDTVDESGDA